MEREYSNQSLSSRGGGSEMGSRYVTENGFYMTSFAATILVASLLTVGVLLITLLIALTVMLQSCESKSQGSFNISNWIDNFNYCNVLSLHAELNGLDLNDFPEVCKIAAVQYIRGGQYARNLNLSMEVAESYFDGVKPLEDGTDLVLIDIDDLFPSRSHYAEPLQSRFSEFGCSYCLEEAENLKRLFTLKLYTKLQAGGWPLILFSRNPEEQRNATIEQLVFAGFGGWSSLAMRLDDKMQLDNHEYFFRLRDTLWKQGFHIAAVISSQMDALTGPCSGTRVFKLPNPIYHNIGTVVQGGRSAT